MKKILFVLLVAFLPLLAKAIVYDTNRGFRHPGGLHSETDFQRIRQQLKDGNAKVKAAYQVLCNAAYAQSTVSTSPVETIVRGGGSGENYINAARGATIAYQNALRWRIGGQEVFAKHAVEVLMKWARTTKYIGGDSNYALAAGLYGYEFAQAAELVRDYEGWPAEDFEEFKQWMLSVWYPSAIGFLRGRNGTWENTGKWWQAPGHYWSNWGLCNALCIISIGVLCDDVFIYNQGMSYYKYDQCGTFRNPRTEVPIKNDGLSEFLGNLIVTTIDSEMESGAYGQLGQTQESGRDIGHATMAIGLAVDISKVGWNQGDDLFAYMDHRLAAGLEYVAAQTRGVSDLPWTNYHVASSGYYYTDSRAALQTAPALGEQIRPYWGSVIGIYESVKGVSMPYAEWAYARMGTDGGGQGTTSGGYDHLGYSVLMNTRDEQLAVAENIPTELTPKMIYSGTLTANLVPSLSNERSLGNISGSNLYHNELGGLVNTYKTNNQTGVPTGKTIILSPQLPDGATDTGLWLWETGETTREITVTTDRSYIYRVQYTNENGITSEQSFAIAVQGDCTPSAVTPSITFNGETLNDSVATVLYGTSVTLKLEGTGGYNTWEWSNGRTTQSITLSSLKQDTSVQGTYVNQGGAKTSVNFHIKVVRVRPLITVDENEVRDSVALVQEGTCVKLVPEIGNGLTGGDYLWDDGTTEASVTYESIDRSVFRKLTYAKGGQTYDLSFSVYVRPDNDSLLQVGNYMIREIDTDRYLTGQGMGSTPSFQPLDDVNPLSQQWYIYRTSSVSPYYDFVLLADSSYLNVKGRLVTKTYRPYRITFAAGTVLAAIYTNSTTANPYLVVADDGTIDFAGSPSLYGYPFELIPISETAINPIPLSVQPADDAWFDLGGRRVMTPKKGIYLQRGVKRVVR